MANRFDITKVPIGQAIQSRRDASPGPGIAQVTKPGVERGGFDQLEHGSSVNCGFHVVNEMNAAAGGRESPEAWVRMRFRVG